MTGVPRELEKVRSKWKYTGGERPAFAVEPGPGQESVWDYPRPPRIELDARKVVVRHGTKVIAESRASVRVLETASAPSFYLPPNDVRLDLLRPSGAVSLCEWKGRATYWSLVLPAITLHDVGWSYPDPYGEFEGIAGFLSFYPGRVECTVAGEHVRPQPGDFYGGWLTDEIVGPVKGGPGTSAW